MCKNNINKMILCHDINRHTTSLAGLKVMHAQMTDAFYFTSKQEVLRSPCCCCVCSLVRELMMPSSENKQGREAKKVVSQRSSVTQKRGGARRHVHLQTPLLLGMCSSVCARATVYVSLIPQLECLVACPCVFCCQAATTRTSLHYSLRHAA